ncbi:hypothetical protein SUGI_1474420 [Cryptomeria japonica]|uniref:Uncharacterized protein n=1 Tax=Cryptomeria japonica TaxID=3369 RepID=A0AAD3NT91_CRYJA|nr:hypothetical protein SUGI_1474420 [Cryptomeria japonica]
MPGASLPEIPARNNTCQSWYAWGVGTNQPASWNLRSLPLWPYRSFKQCPTAAIMDLFCKQDRTSDLKERIKGSAFATLSITQQSEPLK